VCSSDLDPKQVIQAINDYMVKLKNVEGREFTEKEATEMAFRLGPRWGEEMRRSLGWEWIVFLGDHGFQGYAIAAPDRSVICLPMNTIYKKLLEEDPDITMLLLFNMIKGGEAAEKPGRYMSIG
jgi:hypothetical protein